MARSNKKEVLEMPEVAAELEQTESIANVVGIVSNCGRLNVRRAPNKMSKVITEIPVDTEVIVNLEKSTDEWYKVCVNDNVKGFCMKNYIALK